MLKIKKLLTKLLTYENVSPASSSTFITAASGFSIPNSNLIIYRNAKIIQGTFRVSPSSAWAANSTSLVGTVKSPFVPPISAFVGSSECYGIIGADGKVWLTPIRAVSAGAQISVAFTMMTK